MGKKLEVALGVLNGLIGDYLARTGNGLATEMTLVHEGEPLALERDAVSRAYPSASPHVAILVHGVSCTEDVWSFSDGSDYGSLLSRDLGITPLYLRYNSGRAIPDNGTELASLLDSLLDVWPVPIEEVLPLGYSMGGLVVRSACHTASLSSQRWLPLVRRAIYVGTPHLGAPLERAGRLVTKVLQAIDDPYTRLVAEVAELRSDGVKDLGDADLRHADRARRTHGLSLRDPRHPVPLLESIRHYLVAGSLWGDSRFASLFGDTMVPVSSATDGLCVDAASLALPPDRVKILKGLAHVPLAHHPDVYAQIRAWCEEKP
jgi:hypothetical protein